VAKNTLFFGTLRITGFSTTVRNPG
jgi:hypothetical protein